MTVTAGDVREVDGDDNSDTFYVGCERDYAEEDTDTSEEEESDEEGPGETNEEVQKQEGELMTDETPLAKRAKTSATCNGATKTNTDTEKEAHRRLMPTLPLEMLSEIASYASPGDILNLTRTSKLFRKTLMSRTATTVWKTARERVGILAPPEAISEPAWAALLFGRFCQTCGQKSLKRVDFFILRRFCQSCRREHLCHEKTFESIFPETDKSIQHLVPFTNDRGPYNGHANWDRFFWDEDIDIIVRKLDEFEHQVCTGVPNVVEKLEAFKKMQEAKVEFSHLNEEALTEWHGLHLERRRHPRRWQIVDRFKKLGYTEDDLVFMQSYNEGAKKNELSDRDWDHLRREMEPQAAKLRSKRLESETVKIRWKRRIIVDRLYKAYKRTLQPSQWRYLPRTLDITFLEPFKALVDAPLEDGALADESFKEAFAMLPSLLSSKAEDRKAVLRAMLPSGSEDFDEGNPLSTSAPRDNIDLAIAVFICTVPGHKKKTHFPLLFGWDEIFSHHCRPQDRGLCVPSGLSDPWVSYSRQGEKLVSEVDEDHAKGLQVTFHPKAEEVTRKVLRLVALDPKNSTAADLDARDERFGCTGCLPGWDTNALIYGRLGFTWRALVAHLLESDDHDPQSRVFLLSAAEAEEIRKQETVDTTTLANSKTWTCAHCVQYVDDLRTRLDIVRHLRSSHAIENAVEPFDLFAFKRFSSIPITSGKLRYAMPLPPGVTGAPISRSNKKKNKASGQIRCLKCPRSARTFVQSGVIAHLQTKHNVKNPSEGTDYAPRKT